MSTSDSQFSRRQFLEFLGASSLTVATASLVPNFLSGCATSSAVPSSLGPFLKPTSKDDLVLAPGLKSTILIKWKDPISSTGMEFGTNNDYCAFIPKDRRNPTDGILMVNHEFVSPLFVSGYDEKLKISKTKEQVDIEQKSVGVSLLRFHFQDGEWRIDPTSSHNRRITAQTPIPLVSDFPIEGAQVVQGTLANCAGGITPWGTFLTCEENYDQFYGEWDYSPKPGMKAPRKFPRRLYTDKDLRWSLYQDLPATHYGWVTEIDPWTGKAKKLTALGRFAHEGATCTTTSDGRTVVYMGDDCNDQCLYKFISTAPGSLEKGTLYVAQLETGRWLPITMNAHPEFSLRFRHTTDLSMRTREAARVLGGTPLDRPEDVEINPLNGDVIVSLTNHVPHDRPHGSILKIREKNGDPASLSFNSSTWISGGPEAGLSCPDNLAFDKSGNLWCTNDIADDKLNQGVYEKFKNNGLYFVPMHGPSAGQVFQVASAPRDAELTGPMFTPDGETLLISVQHPGEQTKNLAQLTSYWPDGPGHLPKSAVVAITGDRLKDLVNYRG